MKKLKTVMLLLLPVALPTYQLKSDIDFGSTDSGFVINGGTFNPGTSPYKGTIKLLGNSTLSTNNLTLDDAVIEVIKKESYGTVTMTVANTAGSNQQFRITATDVNANDLTGSVDITYSGMTSSTVSYTQGGTNTAVGTLNSSVTLTADNDYIDFSVANGETITITVSVTQNTFTTALTMGDVSATMVRGSGHIMYSHNSGVETSLSASSSNAVTLANSDTIDFVVRTAANAERFYGRMTGTYTTAGAIQLGNNEVLHLERGETVGAITVTADDADPAIVEGMGQFASTITIDGSAADACLKLDLQGIMNQDITFNGDGSGSYVTKLILADDLYFADDKEFVQTNSAAITVDTAGHTIHYGGKALTTTTPMTLLDTATNGIASVELHDKLTLNAAWTGSANGLVINGNGNAFKFDTSGSINSDFGDLYFTNITLEDIDANKLSSLGNFYLSDVVLADGGGNGTIRVNPLGEGSSVTDMPVQVTLTAGGEFFSDTVTWNTGVSLDLLRDVSVSTTWTFNRSSVINAHGSIIDLTSNGTLALDATNSPTLTIRDAIIKVDADTNFTIPANTTLNLRNCTIVISTQNIDLSAQAGTLSVGGDCTFITGNYTFTGATTFNVADGILWYDTLGNEDQSNIKGLDSGSAVAAPLTAVSSIAYSSTAASLAKSEFLYPSDDASPRIASFSGSFTFDGNSRSFIFANASTGHMISVADSGAVTATNLVLDGLRSSNISLGSGASWTFGNGSVIRLQSDDTLGKTYTTAASATVEIDLRGHTLDLGSYGLTLGTASTVTVKNGTLTGFTNGSVSFGDAAATLVLEDVKVVLDSNFSPATGAVQFKGDCEIISENASGTTYSYTIATAHTIAENARLTVHDGATLAYAHTTDAEALTFAGRNSRLDLMGATLSIQENMTLSTGILWVDHKVNMTGDSTLTFMTGAGYDFDVKFYPGATAQVLEGVTVVRNTTSLGQ